MRVRTTAILLLIIGLLLAGASCFHNSSGGASADLPDVVSYNFDIRPILSDKCFECHGRDGKHREANLRLDLEDSAYAPLKVTRGAFAIVPGKPEQSALLKRVGSTDDSYRMPPPDAHLGTLTIRETKIFEKWIRQGGRYEKHWAFAVPVKSPLPQPKDTRWARNEIDYFILDKLDKIGLKPNEEADRERLLKRVSLDITGLPPSLQRMDAFLADKTDKAYDKMLDEYRIEYLIDKTKTYGKGILGVTIECAQCHDHKYDPFAQKDYYSLLAFFNNTKEVGYEGDVGVSKPAKMPILTINDSDLHTSLAFLNKKDTDTMIVSVMGERDTLRKTYVLSRGRYDAPADEVRPAGLPPVVASHTLHNPPHPLALRPLTP